MLEGSAVHKTFKAMCAHIFNKTFMFEVEFCSFLLSLFCHAKLLPSLAYFEIISGLTFCQSQSDVGAAVGNLVGIEDGNLVGCGV